jgi:serine/threonine protein kinase
MTQGPHVTGTKKYMASELQARQPRNSSSDIFSLGCVFLELLYILIWFRKLEVNNFSTEMPTLHAILEKHGSLPDHRAFLVFHTIQMTAQVPHDRPSARYLAEDMCTFGGLCCEQCSLSHRKTGDQGSSMNEVIKRGAVTSEATGLANSLTVGSGKESEAEERTC